MDSPVKPDITITRAQNGWVVVSPAYEEGFADRVEVVEEADRDVHGLNLLRYLVEELGIQGTRHDAQRIHVGSSPGDKHHDFHPAPCAECECECDPDQSTPLDLDGEPFCPTGFAQRYHDTGECKCATAGL
jgi:hypothetical protein